VRTFRILSLLAVVPSAAATQQLQLGPRLAVGDGSAFTVQAAIRADVLWQQWGFYTGVGLREATSLCTLTCSLPSSPAWELVAGLTGGLRGTPAYFSVGAGATRWGGGTDLLFEGEFGTRLPLSRRLKVGVGVHAQVMPGVERADVRKVDVHFIELVVSLSALVRRR
jgi:hypothetical protein